MTDKHAVELKKALIAVFPTEHGLGGSSSSGRLLCMGFDTAATW